MGGQAKWGPKGIQRGTESITSSRGSSLWGIAWRVADALSMELRRGGVRTAGNARVGPTSQTPTAGRPSAQ
eukprot:5562240-Pyramimonas_sp.AAC.1